MKTNNEIEVDERDAYAIVTTSVRERDEYTKQGYKYVMYSTKAGLTRYYLSKDGSLKGLFHRDDTVADAQDLSNLFNRIFDSWSYIY